MSSLLTEIVIIVVLILVNAFLAASEIAIAAARKPRLRALADDGNPAAARVLALNENPGRFLATVQVGITLSGFFASAIGAVSLVEAVSSWLAGAPLDAASRNASTIALVLVTALLSFASIIFGELVPKTLAVQQAEAVALRAVRPIDVLSQIARPIVFLLTATTNGVLRLFGARSRAALPSVTQDELLAMLEAAEDEGVVEAADADLIEHAFEFGATTVESVMVPRVDVTALDGEIPLEHAVTVFFSSGYSRVPIYEDRLDNVVGILHVKDVFRLLWTRERDPSTPVRDVARPAYFVPQMKPIDELLAELRARRVHMAVVVDEFGGVSGIVTLEDLLEELVGEIVDEFDPGQELVREVAPGVIEVSGRLPVADLLGRLELDRDALGPAQAVSVGGLVVNALGRIPRERQMVDVPPLRLQVTKMVGHRVGRVLVRVEAAARGGAE